MNKLDPHHFGTYFLVKDLILLIFLINNYCKKLTKQFCKLINLVNLGLGV
jgi:hypothetical protein